MKEANPKSLQAFNIIDLLKVEEYYTHGTTKIQKSLPDVSRRYG